MAKSKTKEPTPKTSSKPPIEPDSPPKPRGVLIRYDDPGTNDRIETHRVRLEEASRGISVNLKSAMRNLMLLGLALSEVATAAGLSPDEAMALASVEVEDLVAMGASRKEEAALYADGHPGAGAGGDA